MATQYLTDNTLLIHPETAIPTPLTKGQKLPDWAKDEVGDHLLTTTKPGSEDDEDEGDTPNLDAELPEDAPPVSGKGSGIDAWKAYADSIGVEYDPATTDKAVIIDAVKAAQG